MRNGVKGVTRILPGGESSVLIREKILVGLATLRAGPQGPAEKQSWSQACSE